MKRGKGAAQKKTAKCRGTGKGKKSVSQTNQPFEQDTKRRIGHFGGAGEPPLMKK